MIETRAKIESTRNRQIDLSAGYFGQTLEGVSPFQGFLVGLRIPFDTRKNNVLKQQARIESQMLTHETEAQKYNLKNEIEALNAQLLILLQSIASYDTQLLQQQNDIREKSLVQFEAGEIDYVCFSQIQERLVEQYTRYLTLKRTYNEQRILLDFLTLKN